MITVSDSVGQYVDIHVWSHILEAEAPININSSINSHASFEKGQSKVAFE